MLDPDPHLTRKRSSPRGESTEERSRRAQAVFTAIATAIYLAVGGAAIEATVGLENAHRLPFTFREWFRPAVMSDQFAAALFAGLVGFVTGVARLLDTLLVTDAEVPVAVAVARNMYVLFGLWALLLGATVAVARFRARVRGWSE